MLEESIQKLIFTLENVEDKLDALAMAITLGPKEVPVPVIVEQRVSEAVDTVLEKKPAPKKKKVVKKVVKKPEPVQQVTLPVDLDPVPELEIGTVKTYTAQDVKVLAEELGAKLQDRSIALTEIKSVISLNSKAGKLAECTEEEIQVIYAEVAKKVMA